MKHLLKIALVIALLLPALGMAAAPARAQASTLVYTVQYGDTLGTIAWRYNTSVSAIASLNGIANPSRIYTGQQLVIPTGGTYPTYPPTSGHQVHVVQPGQNLFRIGLLYGYDVTTMAALNGLWNPNQIYAGQRLLIPRTQYHTVRYGETVASIARAYGSTIGAISAANHLWNANLIYPGQVLLVP
ncbi:MAG: LysM peptidoglycan-binding domain-containing protein [Anaerolineae bacterium]|nr:LysM peptidoglycan-binding domain-containing protein [Anaerolineae bacterium]